MAPPASPRGAEEGGALDDAVLEEHTEPAWPELSTYMVDDLRGQEPPSGAPRPHPARPACRQARLAPCCAAQGKDGKGTSGGGSKRAASGRRPFFDSMALHLGMHDAPEQSDAVMAAKPHDDRSAESTGIAKTEHSESFSEGSALRPLYDNCALTSVSERYECTHTTIAF